MIPKARVLSRDPASSTARISFQLSRDHPLLSGVRETGLGNHSLVLPIPVPFLRELGPALQTVFPFQREQVGGLEREKEAGGGVGQAPGRRPWQPVKEAVFRGLPASPFSSSPAAPIPRALRPLHYPSAHSRGKGFKEPTFMKVWRTRCTSYKAGQYLAAEPFLQMLLFKCSDAGRTGGLAPSLRCLSGPLGLGRCVLRSTAVLQWRVSSATRRPSLHPSPPEASWAGSALVPRTLSPNSC